MSNIVFLYREIFKWVKVKIKTENLKKNDLNLKIKLANLKIKLANLKIKTEKVSDRGLKSEVLSYKLP